MHLGRRYPPCFISVLCWTEGSFLIYYFTFDLYFSKSIPDCGSCCLQKTSGTSQRRYEWSNILFYDNPYCYYLFWYQVHLNLTRKNISYNLPFMNKNVRFRRVEILIKTSTSSNTRSGLHRIKSIPDSSLAWVCYSFIVLNLYLAAMNDNYI